MFPWLGPVYTEGGMVEGENNRVGLFASIDVFKGIPFAAPPGRFEDPKLHPGWTGVLKATSFAPRCLQATVTQTDVRGSEDCLYLNIWVPQGSKVSTNLPVMVWIYGGGFFLGGSQGANVLNNYLYDGEEIAVRGNVIVVTFNYRLGPLGFLSTGDENAPGNYGLKDQHMAISWVKRNIAAFGGDPSNITIFGESAGAASVSLQTLSPHNNGLIRRAISQSGVALCSWAIQRDPLFWAQEVARKVGCPVKDSAAMISCLKISDPKAVTLAFHLNLIDLKYPLVYYLGFSPVIDGDFIPDEPSKLFHNAADIDYITGTNDMDGHIFAGIDLPVINRPIAHIQTEEIYDLIKGMTLDKDPEAADSVYALYTKNWSTSPSQNTMKQTVVDLETDLIFFIASQRALSLHQKNANSGKTYSYLFSHASRMPVYPGWVGADHADDLQYVFGKPFVTPLGYRPRDRDVSSYMIAYWTNFARTGDPNKGESKVPVQWKQFTAENKEYLEINHKMNSSSAKQGLRSEFVKFWTETYTQFNDSEVTAISSK
ncbi:bile salt-activated lipase-like [Protopterus annectens]|uniref:bile salt-activated lipase-like n=1 Tax=Protopterus annectens TaxID=7888 RepID=UPI001CFA5CEF|nr:bile salt-activated lipase-like [Protopterus annectens]